jgi:hypothetical protein
VSFLVVFVFSALIHWLGFSVLNQLIVVLGRNNIVRPLNEHNLETDGIPTPDNDAVLVGLAVCWENSDVYYISLTSTTAASM